LRSLFSNAGIYAIIDLSLPVNGSIDSSEPYWSTNLLDLYIQTIEVFSKYDNLLAVNVGNEVVTQTTTGSAAFVKAAARDIKAYLYVILDNFQSGMCFKAPFSLGTPRTYPLWLDMLTLMGTRTGVALLLTTCPVTLPARTPVPLLLTYSA
jgi:hypothetical protein